MTRTAFAVEESGYFMLQRSGVWILACRAARGARGGVSQHGSSRLTDNPLPAMKSRLLDEVRYDHQLHLNLMATKCIASKTQKRRPVE